MALISDPVSAVAGVVQSIINEFPTPEQKAAAQQSLAQMYMNGSLQAMTTQAGVITAEAQSMNKLEASWRPILMYVFMTILVFNYILAPLIQAIFHVVISLPVPPQMWTLLDIGVGGYITSRGIEKVTTPHPVTGVSPIASTIQGVANVFKGN
jgi:hypothetical protein